MEEKKEKHCSSLIYIYCIGSALYFYLNRVCSSNYYGIFKGFASFREAVNRCCCCYISA